jgi:hypothetical protein
VRWIASVSRRPDNGARRSQDRQHRQQRPWDPGPHLVYLILIGTSTHLASDPALTGAPCNTAGRIVRLLSPQASDRSSSSKRRRRSSIHSAGVLPSGNGTPARLRQRASPSNPLGHQQCWIV